MIIKVCLQGYKVLPFVVSQATFRRYISPLLSWLKSKTCKAPALRKQKAIGSERTKDKTGPKYCPSYLKPVVNTFVFFTSGI